MSHDKPAGKHGRREPLSLDTEDAYWREQWEARADENGELDWEDFSPAYRYGAEAFAANPDRKFEEVEHQLSEGWELARGVSKLDWADARLATLDAWMRAWDLTHRKP